MTMPGQILLRIRYKGGRQECIKLAGCNGHSEGEPASSARPIIWEAFRCHWDTDSLSNCVPQTHLIFSFSVLSRLPGGSVLMSWMMISKSRSSCSARNNEESHRKGIRSGWDKSGHSRGISIGPHSEQCETVWRAVILVNFPVNEREAST